MDKLKYYEDEGTDSFGHASSSDVKRGYYDASTIDNSNLSNFDRMMASMGFDGDENENAGFAGRPRGDER